MGNHPSVIQWDIFNEAWGQHDTTSLTNWLMAYDPTRLVDSASGFNLYNVGQVCDIHDYPGPGTPQAKPGEMSVIGEFGGITTAFPGHMWTDPSQAFGYNKIGDPALLATSFPPLMQKVWPLIANPGISGTIYTQLTDVEQEANGLMTYDRVPKIDPDIIRNANRLPDGTPGALRAPPPRLRCRNRPTASATTETPREVARVQPRLPRRLRAPQRMGGAVNLGRAVRRLVAHDADLAVEFERGQVHLLEVGAARRAHRAPRARPG